MVCSTGGGQSIQAGFSADAIGGGDGPRITALPHLTSASVHLTGMAFSYFKRERKGGPGRARGGHHVLQQGDFN